MAQLDPSWIDTNEEDREDDFEGDDEDDDVEEEEEVEFIHSIYTYKIFNRFQEEERKRLNCKARKDKDGLGFSMYEVRDITIPHGCHHLKPRIDTVYQDKEYDKVFAFAESLSLGSDITIMDDPMVVDTEDWAMSKDLQDFVEGLSQQPTILAK
ncbi:hypothetical protein Syun_025316 [Stephania yunnanensis]|uniref:Uncharacterized protein n=1 Tax=Stephania yunnanensis TaxID=152371 RepID=A0AAP0ERG8_9MAGN